MLRNRPTKRYSGSEDGGQTTERSGGDLSVLRRPSSVVISHGDIYVVQDQPNPNDGSGQILSFQMRRRLGMPRHAPIAPDGDGAEPADDLAAFEEEDCNIDYRHRMLMNVIAVVIVSVLISAGV